MYSFKYLPVGTHPLEQSIRNQYPASYIVPYQMIHTIYWDQQQQRSNPNPSCGHAPQDP